MCNICNGQEPLIMPYSPFRLKVINRKFYLEKFDSYVDEWDSQTYSVTQIKYCPLCGESLVPLEDRYIRVQRFTINSKLPSLNEYIKECKTNKYSANKFKQDVEEVILYDILQSKIQSINKPVYIQFEWHEPTKRRDVDNVYSAKKFILDALQKINIIPNDSPKWVLDCDDKIIYDKTQKVIIELREVK